VEYKIVHISNVQDTREEGETRKPDKSDTQKTERAGQEAVWKRQGETGRTKEGREERKEIKRGP